MLDQRSPAGPDDEPRFDDEAGFDRTILDLLLHDDSQRPWALDELARELGDEAAARDALERLAAGGLVHRFDCFAFAARPAVLAARLGED